MIQSGLRPAIVLAVDAVLRDVMVVADVKLAETVLHDAGRLDQDLVELLISLPGSGNRGLTEIRRGRQFTYGMGVRYRRATRFNEVAESWPFGIACRKT
jgi:hypothetical protein